MGKWTTHSQTASRQDIKIGNNGTWQDAFQFDPDATDWTLEGQTFELDVQRNPYDEVPLLSLSSVNGRIIVADAVQRVIYMNVDPLDIQGALSPGVYVYDLVMIDGVDPAPPAVRVPLMYGTLEVVQGVTYPPV
jgi:hypothetical protein